MQSVDDTCIDSIVMEMRLRSIGGAGCRKISDTFVADVARGARYLFAKEPKTQKKEVLLKNVTWLDTEETGWPWKAAEFPR